MLKVSSFTSNRLQYSFKVPTKWDGGSGKTKMERTHSRYSKCGICGVLQGFKPSTRSFEIQQGLLAIAIHDVPRASPRSLNNIRYYKAAFTRQT